MIATDAVGAAAGGLVRDGDNGLVVAGRRRAARWPARSTRLAEDPQLRARLGAQGAARRARLHLRGVGARASPQALASLGLSRERW